MIRLLGADRPRWAKYFGFKTIIRI